MVWWFGLFGISVLLAHLCARKPRQNPRSWNDRPTTPRPPAPKAQAVPKGPTMVVHRFIWR
jgi:hypothetical protein